jgi:glutathione S-transferase
MTDAIAFYHNPQSRGRIVHWMLEEVNAPYEIKVVDFERKEHKAPDFLAINPMGKIPAIIDHMFSRPPPSRPTAMGYGNYADTLNTLEKALSPGPFILGERFSAADVYMGSAIGWGLGMKAIEPRPAFGAYLGRVSLRPAYQRAMAQSEALQKKT